MFDFLISNEDSHYNNFGFIRDVNTLKFIKFAPLFDNGCSLWYNKLDSDIGSVVNCKPFNTNFFKQVGYVSNKSILNLSFDITKIIIDTFAEHDFSLQRAEKISKYVLVKHILAFFI